jgi:hypothetical protein
VQTVNSSKRVARAGVVFGAVAIVLYIGATIASAVEYNVTEAAGLPIDGPPAAILLAGSVAIGLGIAALALLVLAWILRTATRRNITNLS